MILPASIARHLDALLAAYLGDGQLARVDHVSIVSVDTTNKIANCQYRDGTQRSLPYPSALPTVGEVWRVVEPEGSGARLEDWVPNGSLT